jgi:hypothetical protein
MDINTILNYKILDTTAEYMQSYNWIYQPFNLIEGIIWLLYVPKTIMKYWKNADKQMVTWQAVSFILFALSDFIEMNSTSVLLILFKFSILVALIVGHKAIILSINNTVHQVAPPQPAGRTDDR